MAATDPALAPTTDQLLAEITALRAELAARPKAGAVTQQFLLGLLLFVGGEVLSYLTNGAAGTMIASVGFALAGLAPSPAPITRGGQRGIVRASLLWTLAGIGLGLGGAALLASGGCALLERREIHTTTAPEVTYGVEDGRCVLRGFTDGHETYTAIGPVGEPCPPVATKP